MAGSCHPYLPRDSSVASRPISLQFPEVTAEFDERAGLVLQPGCQIVVQDTLFIVKEIMHGGNEYSLGKIVGVAIAKNLLKMLDRAQSSELPGRNSHVTYRLSLKALGERKKINKKFQGPAHAAIVLGGYDHQARRVQYILSKLQYFLWFVAVCIGRKSLRR